MPEFVSHMFCVLSYVWKRMVVKTILFATEQSKYVKYNLTFTNLVFSKKLCVALFKLTRVLFCWENNLVLYVYLYNGHKRFEMLPYIVKYFLKFPYILNTPLFFKKTQLTFQYTVQY